MTAKSVTEVSENLESPDQPIIEEVVNTKYKSNKKSLGMPQQDIPEGDYCKV